MQLQNERTNLDNVLLGIEQRLNAVSFDLDLDSYQEEIERLLERCQRLRAFEEEKKAEMASAFNDFRAIEEQIAVVTSAHEALRQDRKFSGKLEDPVVCPTCNAVYPNGFAERLQIALDEDTCLELLTTLQEQRGEAEAKWESSRRTVQDAKSAAADVEEILNTKRGDVALADVLRREGQKDVSRAIGEDIKTLNTKIGELDQAQEAATTEMKNATDRSRQQEIRTYYLGEMTRLLQRLNVSTISEKNYRALDANIRETGSTLPRALLAYYFALLTTINKFSSSTLCPIVIDSPRQQDPDPTNWKRIIECIRDEQPEDSQLILATTTDEGVSFGGSVIDIDVEKAVLNRSEFDAASDELRPLIESSLKARNT